MKAPAKERKKPGPPRTTGPGEQVVVRLHQPMLGAIDTWRSGQEGETTRAEALRRLAQRGLEALHAEPASAVKQAVGAKAASREKARQGRASGFLAIVRRVIPKGPRFDDC